MEVNQNEKIKFFLHIVNPFFNFYILYLYEKNKIYFISRWINNMPFPDRFLVVAPVSAKLFLAKKLRNTLRFFTN